MSAAFEELDARATPIGEIALRRRFDRTIQTEIYEVKLGDEYLMTSLFTAAEIALGHLGTAAVEGDDLDVVIGGLGLGYTAGAVLEDDRVRSVHVVEYLDAVIGWHDRRLLPASPALADDDRCLFVHGNFFELVAGGGFGPTVPVPCHAILLDIDHTPRHLLHPSHAPFYEVGGLRQLAALLHPGGVYALWSDDPPDERHLAAMHEVFGNAEGHEIAFPNPYTGGEGTNSVSVAVR